MSTAGNLHNQSATVLRDNPFSSALTKTRHNVEQYVVRKQSEMLDRTRELDERGFSAFEHDYLLDARTGLLNEVAFNKKFHYEVMRARRYERPVSLLLIAFDNLDEAIQHFGNLIVDDLCLQLADLLRKSTRDTDVLGRLGPNLFAVACIEADIPHALVVARRIGSRMWTRPMLPRRTTTATVSIGVASSNLDGVSTEKLYEKCIEHLQMAQHSDGNCVFYSAEIEEPAKDQKRTA
ncbi:MAG TPA: GGDEF domain-containing protein [Candidatus Obscuribacterales bacterium]